MMYTLTYNDNSYGWVYPDKYTALCVLDDIVKSEKLEWRAEGVDDSIAWYAYRRPNNNASPDYVIISIKPL